MNSPLRTLVVSSLLILSFNYLGAQNIYTVAGGGYGDNGAATNAVCNPNAVISDKNGNVYIAMSGLVRKVNSQGIITTVAGNGYPNSAKDSDLAIDASIIPQDIKLDQSGFLYILSGLVPHSSSSGPIGGELLKVNLVNGTIVKIAGDRLEGGDPTYQGPVAGAKFTAPLAMAFDNNDNLFIADSERHVIRKIDRQTNEISTIAGDGISGYTGDNGLAITARLSYPTGLVINSNGDIYISDTGNNVIRKIDGSSGIIQTVAGNGVVGYSGDNGSALQASLNLYLESQRYRHVGMLIGSNGSLLFTDIYNNVIRNVNLTTGNITTYAGTGEKNYSGDNGLAANATFNNPRDISMDSQGNIYIADYFNLVVRRIRTNGIINTFAGNGNFEYGGENGLATDARINGPQDVLIDQFNNILIAHQSGVRKVDNSTKKITTIIGNGIAGYSGDGGFATNASIGLIKGIAMDSKGNLYITDSQFHYIRKVTTLGIISTIAGNGTNGYSGDDGLAIYAKLNEPAGIVIDQDDNLYFSDSRNHVIRKINLNTGIIITVAGNGLSGKDGNGGIATSARLNLPRGLVLSKDKNELFIADYFNHQIRKIDFTTGKIFLVAGTGASGFSEDGDLAINTKLNIPNDVAIDEKGDIYFTDSGNPSYRVRKISIVTEVISTIAGNGTDLFNGNNGVAVDIGLYFPQIVTFDSNEVLFFGDLVGRVFKYITTANFTGTSLPTTYDHNATLTSSVTVDDASKAFFVNLKSKGISEPESAYKTASVTPSGNKFETSVTPNDPIGLEYYYEVIDEASVKKETAKGRAYVRYPSTSSAQILPALRFGGEQKDYQIISVPLNLNNKEVTTVFKDLGPADPTQWRLFTYDNTKPTNKTTEYKSGNIEAGKGYWLIARRFKEVNPGEGTTVQVHTDNPFTLNLTPGWNLVGNPYNFKIGWQDILTANNNPTGLTGFTVFEGGILSPSPTLDRYRGAFVFTPNAISLKVPTLRNTSLPGGRIKNANADVYESEQHWELNFTLTDGDLSNELCGVGMNPTAKEGMDDNDRISFPTPEGMSMPALIFKLNTTEETLSKSIVNSQDTYSWTMGVKQGQSPTTISWSTETLDKNINDFFLFDPVTRDIIDMKKQNNFTINANTKSLVLHYGNSEYIKQKLDDEIPTFGKPYPNPASERVTIPIHISEQMGKSIIKVEVYNSLGTKVETLTNTEYNPGSHNLQWSPSQPHGLYMIKMQANTANQRVYKVVLKDK